MISELQEKLKHINYYNGIFCGDPKPLLNQKEPIIILYKEYTNTVPEYSVVMPIFNQEDIIEKNILSVFTNIDGNFEIIIILDFCVDNTENIVLNLLNNTSIKNLTKAIVIQQKSPVFETTCDNMGFLLSSGKYILEIQADMEMTEYGFNTALVRGLKKYKDIIGISGRCTHVLGGGSGIGKLGESVENSLSPDLDRNKLYMFGTCNRGPLLLDNEKLKIMKYLDEQHFFLHDSDHDLFARAYYQKSWKCGYIPIEFKSPLKNGSTRKTLKKEFAEINKIAYNEKMSRSIGGFLRTHPYQSNKIPIEIRSL